MNTVNAIKHYGRVFDLLVSIGGANESQRDDFVFHHARCSPPCTEYRFQGKLGFGGKYLSSLNKVCCYSEDLTKKRLEIIDRLNAELRNLPPCTT